MALPGEASESTTYCLTFLGQRLAESCYRMAWRESKRFAEYLGSEEAVGLAMMGLVKAAANYDPERGAFSTYAHHWITGLLRAAAWKQQQRTKKGQFTTPLTPLCAREQPSREQDPATLIANTEEARQVNSLLRHLPARERDVVRMYYREDKDTADIARHFGFSRSYAQSLLVSARKRLKFILESKQRESA